MQQEMNAFNSAIRKARQEGHAPLAARIDIERRVCTALVREILSRGYNITVNDGEDDVLTHSRKFHKIIYAMFSTDSDQLEVCDMNGNRLGVFILVYGNDGYDVISDWQAPVKTFRELNDIADALNPVIEKAEKARAPALTSGPGCGHAPGQYSAKGLARPSRYWETALAAFGCLPPFNFPTPEEVPVKYQIVALREDIGQSLMLLLPGRYSRAEARAAVAEFESGYDRTFAPLKLIIVPAGED